MSLGHARHINLTLSANEASRPATLTAYVVRKAVGEVRVARLGQRSGMSPERPRICTLAKGCAGADTQDEVLRTTGLVVLALAIGAAGCGGQSRRADSAASNEVVHLRAGDVAGTMGADPVTLSRSGRILWQFEALLRDTFGNRSISARSRPPGSAINFACASRIGCAPLADWSPYFFTFRGPRHSRFHLSKRRFPSGYWGNYPVAVLVKGRFIACDRAEKRFLIAYSDAVGLSLDCK
jgi:hypothetical protein